MAAEVTVTVTVWLRRHLQLLRVLQAAGCAWDTLMSHQGSVPGIVQACGPHSDLVPDGCQAGTCSRGMSFVLTKAGDARRLEGTAQTQHCLVFGNASVVSIQVFWGKDKGGGKTALGRQERNRHVRP